MTSKYDLVRQLDEKISDRHRTLYMRHITTQEIYNDKGELLCKINAKKGTIEMLIPYHELPEPLKKFAQNSSQTYRISFYNKSPQ